MVEVVIVVFWPWWCSVCPAKNPQLARRLKTHGDHAQHTEVPLWPLSQQRWRYELPHASLDQSFLFLPLTAILTLRFVLHALNFVSWPLTWLPITVCNGLFSFPLPLLLCFCPQAPVLFFHICPPVHTYVHLYYGPEQCTRCSRPFLAWFTHITSASNLTSKGPCPIKQYFLNINLIVAPCIFVESLQFINQRMHI